MREETKTLLEITKHFLAKYDPLLAKDREKIIKDYGVLENTYRTVEMNIKKLVSLGDKITIDDKTDIILLAGIQETIGYILSFVQVQYKSKVALDIIKSLQLWKNDDGGYFYSIPRHQYDMILETLVIASKITPYDYKEKGEN